MAADRGVFIDQSQSLNVHMAAPNFGKLTSMHFYAWQKGLKTGMYYLRTRPAADAIQFTVDQLALKNAEETKSNASTHSVTAPSFSCDTETLSNSNTALNFGMPGTGKKDKLLFDVDDQINMSVIPRAPGEEDEDVCVSCSS